MPITHWLGQADAVAQVVTVTPAGTIADETFTLTVGGADVAYIATGGDTADEVAAGLADAWNASTHPYHAAVTAAADADVLTLTADEPGVPFVVEVDATGSATLTPATVTASAGPNDWSTAANWSAGAVPVDNDTAVFEHHSAAVLWGLDQSAVTLAELRVMHSYAGAVGLPDDRVTLAAGSADDAKPEYRQARLAIAATVVRIGDNPAGDIDATGAGRIRLDTGSAQTQLHITDTAAQSLDFGCAPVDWIGSHVNNAVHVQAGRIDLAAGQPGDTAVLQSLHVGQPNRLIAPADVRLGAGLSMTTIRQAAGRIAIACDVENLYQAGGFAHLTGSAAAGLAEIAGELQLDAAGGVTTLRIVADGIVDLAADARAKTITNCELYRGSAMDLRNANAGSVTFTNPIALVRCGLDDVTIHTPRHVTIAIDAG